MEWISSCWKLALCLAIFILAVALLVYILAKHEYELKISNKKVEVTREKKPQPKQNTEKRA